MTQRFATFDADRYPTAFYDNHSTNIPIDAEELQEEVYKQLVDNTTSLTFVDGKIVAKEKPPTPLPPEALARQAQKQRLTAAMSEIPNIQDPAAKEVVAALLSYMLNTEV